VIDHNPDHLDFAITPERQAIRQFLSKPAPMPQACGCMGPQAIDGSSWDPSSGTKYEDIKRYPSCPCAMQWHEEIDGQFYVIDENRSPDGITHTATLVGPVGGPYKK
jgi:hypothetical protein